MCIVYVAVQGPIIFTVIIEFKVIVGITAEMVTPLF